MFGDSRAFICIADWKTNSKSRSTSKKGVKVECLKTLRPIIRFWALSVIIRGVALRLVLLIYLRLRHKYGYWKITKTGVRLSLQLKGELRMLFGRSSKFWLILRSLVLPFSPRWVIVTYRITRWCCHSWRRWLYLCNDSRAGRCVLVCCLFLVLSSCVLYWFGRKRSVSPMFYDFVVFQMCYI